MTYYLIAAALLGFGLGFYIAKTRYEWRGFALGARWERDLATRNIVRCSRTTAPQGRN